MLLLCKYMVYNQIVGMWNFREEYIMYLIVASISFSFLGFLFGVAIGGEALAYILGIIGFFAPSMYVLDKLYEKVVMNKEQSVDKIE